MKRELDSAELEIIEWFNYDTLSLNSQMRGLCYALRDRAARLRKWLDRTAAGSHDSIATTNRAADLDEAASALEHYVRDAECALNAAKRQAHYLTQLFGPR